MNEFITDQKAVICLLDNPQPIGYMNVYEPGDVWMKIQGCEACSLENRRKCCTNCPVFIDIGCVLHLEDPRNSRKPFHCIVNPSPDICHSYCQLEFQSIQGSRKGQIRKLSEPGHIFH